MPHRLRTLLTALVFLAGAASVPAMAQSSRQAVLPADTRVEVPDANVLARLVWSTLVAVDNANRADDYGVLRALGTESFQRSQSEASLRAAFAPLRRSRIDVGRTLNQTPRYSMPPTVDARSHLRLRGGFLSRPRDVRFDLIYALESGAWRLQAVSVVELDGDVPL